MARPISSPSGKARVSTNLRIDPDLVAYAKVIDLNLSHCLEQALDHNIKTHPLWLDYVDSLGDEESSPEGFVQYKQDQESSYNAQVRWDAKQDKTWRPR